MDPLERLPEERADMWIQERVVSAHPGCMAASVAGRGTMSAHLADAQMSTEIPLMRRLVAFDVVRKQRVF